jgi:hypothetical protein
MDRYDELERKLASLLGWKPVEGAQGWHDSRGDYRVMLPEWCRDWGDCGRLMVEHSAFPVELKNKGEVTGYAFQHPFPAHAAVSIKDYPNRGAAIRCAIVQAVIAKLSTQQEG